MDRAGLHLGHWEVSVLVDLQAIHRIKQVTVPGQSYLAQKKAKMTKELINKK